MQSQRRFATNQFRNYDIFSFFQNVNCIALNMLEVNAFDPLTGEAHGASLRYLYNLHVYHNYYIQVCITYSKTDVC